MRMWMVKPQILCRQHLLGQHNECHTLAGTIKKGISIKGYVDNNLIEPKSLFKYHDECAQELLNRTYNHKSPLPIFDIRPLIKEEYLIVEVERYYSLFDLLSRCKLCRANYDQMIGSSQEFLINYTQGIYKDGKTII